MYVCGGWSLKLVHPSTSSATSPSFRTPWSDIVTGTVTSCSVASRYPLSKTWSDRLAWNVKTQP